jgi:hypothetical protein
MPFLCGRQLCQFFVLLGSSPFALRVVAERRFRSGRFWRIALALIMADLLPGVMAALRDRRVRTLT